MSNSRKLISAAALCVAGALAAAPGSALAEGPVFRFHDTYSFDVSGQHCGIAVEGVENGVINVMWYEGQGIKVSSSSKATLTNPATGKSVVLSMAGNGDGPAPVIDEEAGTATFVSRFAGLYERIQASDGSVTMVSAGYRAYKQVIDLGTGEFISQEPTVEHGQHPSADETLRCEAIIDALL